MISQGQLDQLIALILAGEFDQVSAFLREEWPELWLALAQYILVQGSAPPTFLENTNIVESWNLHLEPAENFGVTETHLSGTPTAEPASVILPVTGLFVPPVGYRVTLLNAATEFRLLIEQDGLPATGLSLPPRTTVTVTFYGASWVFTSTTSSRTVALVPLTASAGAGGLFAFQNPFSTAIIVKLILDLFDPAGPAVTGDFGTAPDATTSSDNLLDGVDLSAGAIVASVHGEGGTNGREYRRLEVEEWITGTASANPGGLTANMNIELHPAWNSEP